MDYKSPEFRKWLDKLQQESWQLELIISGFAIYGLFMAIDPIDLKSELAVANGNMTYGFGWLVVSIALYILLFNLVVHVLLRGLWIGAIGLRYVSGDIDYENLNYSPKFTSFLKRKVGSFDRYIAQLENYCSILFAVSFLLIFYVIGTALALSSILLFAYFIQEFFGSVNKWVVLLLTIPYLLLILASVIIFIDFLGQGFLKRKKWTSIFYFPIYRLFGILTLSFLYRPLIYNFLDNKFGKRLSILLVPIYIAIILLSSLEHRNSNYLTSNGDSSQYQGVNKHYEDLSAKEDEFVKVASIPSKVIETPYLKVFLLFSENIEDIVFEKNSELKPNEDTRGIYSEFFHEFKRGWDMGSGKKDSTDISQYLKTINRLHELKIDSTVFKSDFLVGMNMKKRLGFETYLNIKDLSEGKHVLIISGQVKEVEFDKKSEITEKTLATIPFWYFPQNAPTISGSLESEVDRITNK